MADTLEDLVDLLKQRFPEGGSKHELHRYLRRVARIALQESESEHCPGGWTECADGTCVPDPIMCSPEPAA